MNARWLSNLRGAWRDWGSRFRSSVALTPVRIAVAYLVVGSSALLLSDVVFVQYLSEPLLSRIQAVKGAIEVLLTAGFILLLTGRRERQLQRHIDRLDRQHEQLEVLHRVLRHNLRNDLNVVRGYTRWIETQSETDRVDSACAKVLGTVERMTRYTEQASRIRRITGCEATTWTYELTELIPALLEAHPWVTSDVDLSVSLPDSATVTANHMFRPALEEVLTNAIEHNDATQRRVAIEVRSAGERVEISVSDNGPGIPDHEITPLREGEESPVVHPSGLGLWFVAWTIRHSNGTLRFETNDWGGTTVRIRVFEAAADAAPVRTNAGDTDPQTERF